MTAQNTLGVARSVAGRLPAMVLAQIDACLQDIGVDAVKIGMLGSPADDRRHVVADRLEEPDPDLPLVFDPVMIATSGSRLADAATIAAFERLMALATLTTPNRARTGGAGRRCRRCSRAGGRLARQGRRCGRRL
jgi:hydroxymethylpyrimidine/phosphomethylpyrimidine kinase